MPLSLSPEWGPYTDLNDARFCLTRFVDRACDPETGIVWTANGNIYPLRAPKRDGDGIGTVAIFDWNQPPPIPRPPSGFWPRVRAFIDRVMEAEGRRAIAEGQAELAMGRAVDQALNRMLTTHRDDGVGVALDVVCVALSIALIPTGLSVIAFFGLIGGGFLLATDGFAYGMELNGDDEGAEDFKKKTEGLRIFATIATLPDIGYGSVKLLKEVAEIRELRTLDRATAAAAAGIAERTTNATRAERLQRIAARASRRAQDRSKKIAVALGLEGTAKGAGTGSVGLLIREEVTIDDSSYHRFLRHLQVHCLAVHRK